ncbi:MAG: thioredoxin-disulfide reductase [Bacillota bacterium]|nr:thioredoxin-disulfide reductase [Bacillota bacterium]HHU43263.1 thioredoxin-disulfide reductase [Clostridiales bacterium]
MYDVIIIGGGPAGLTAALYAARAGKKTLIVENYAIGGQASLTQEIENYSGIKKISGFELTENMRSQAEGFGAEFIYDNIVEISLKGQVKNIKTEYSGEFNSYNIILAMGAKARRLGLEREKQLIGNGVSYCATCDGNFFKDKTVAIVGGGDTALTDAIYLEKLAKKIYIIHRRDEYRGSIRLVEQMREYPKIEEVLDSVVTKLNGMPLESIEVLNKKTQEKREIAVDGLFIAIGQEPQTHLVKDVITLKDGYILTDESMRTNIPGVYAAGDIRYKPLRQILTATADGAIAASNL